MNSRELTLMDKKQDVCLAFTTIKSIFAMQHTLCFSFELIKHLHSHYLNTTWHCERYVHVNTQTSTDKTPTEVQSTE